MIRFSANLGLLWKELSLADAIQAAADAGFDAVECHWPYETDSAVIIRALAEAQLAMLGINTVPGNFAKGERGLLALPARQTEARAAIDQAISYAQEIECPRIHAMAGIASGEAARQCYLDNLEYAVETAASKNIVILIEPLNTFDNPGYFLTSTSQAVRIIDDIGSDHLKMMFDCYHIGRMEGQVEAKLRALLPYIGHIQFASVPDRKEPDNGEVDYSAIFSVISELGYSEPLGAEYHPAGMTGEGLDWMKTLVN
jgi:hydroxypyruvate isomerase